MGIPFKHVNIDVNETKTGELLKSAWNPLESEIVRCSSIQNNIMNFICDVQTGSDPISNYTFMKIHINFTRNDFSFWAIIFPILFIFFLLGTICFLEPKDHYLVARIAITLGVFAFVFTFDSILSYENIRNISTFADFLLKLVLVAIASTISSVIGYRIVTMN